MAVHTETTFVPLLRPACAPVRDSVVIEQALRDLTPRFQENPKLVYHEHFGLTLSTLEQVRLDTSLVFETFVDSFIDTTNFDLLRRGHWLKMRAWSDRIEFILKEQVSSPNLSQYLIG